MSYTIHPYYYTAFPISQTVSKAMTEDMQSEQSRKRPRLFKKKKKKGSMANISLAVLKMLYH